MKKITLLFVALLSLTSAFAQDSESPLVNFDQYEKLVATVKEHRKSRLVSLEDFNALSHDPNVYILDTRSKEMYDRKHVKGAIHLNFADFTQENLDRLFPNRNATILIYCNNNFVEGIQISEITRESILIQDMNFASKVSRPQFNLSLYDGIELQEQTESASQDRTSLEAEPIEEQVKFEAEVEEPITLALNIPTYINLYGYGYRNVYELKELVMTSDPRIQFEGTEVVTIEN